MSKTGLGGFGISSVSPTIQYSANNNTIKDNETLPDGSMSNFQMAQAGLGAANLVYSAFISDPREYSLKKKELGVQQGLLDNKRDEFDLTKENLARQ
ncbi:MAG: hypothetical protein U9R49_06860, partial [Bacteroidota bacterium]|nr:hypothetical protein [Bacteroidota bacterium]